MASNKNINIKLKVWRQNGSLDQGRFEHYTLNDVSTDSSFLEMIDQLNEQLVKSDQDPVAFDHDCREGICGARSMVINGAAHGPLRGTTTCQLHMRSFKNDDTIVIEPFRAKSFPIIKDLMVDRTSLDRVNQAGGYISVNTGSAPDAHSVLVPKQESDMAFDAATCIQCGACVAACKNASAMLFVGAKVSHMALLPQGRPEAVARVTNMVAQMDKEGFGNCTNLGACEAACPKYISLENIARMNREFMGAMVKARGKDSSDNSGG